MAAALVLGTVVLVVAMSRSRQTRSIDGPAAPKIAASKVRRPLFYPPLPISESTEATPEAPVAAAVPAVDEREDEKAAEWTRVATELDRLTKTAGLSENQQARAATIIKTVERARSMIARHPEGAARQAREKQLDEQANLALLAVLTEEQAPLVASYYRAR